MVAPVGPDDRSGGSKEKPSFPPGELGRNFSGKLDLRYLGAVGKYTESIPETLTVCSEKLGLAGVKGGKERKEEGGRNQGWGFAPTTVRVKESAAGLTAMAGIPCSLL